MGGGNRCAVRSLRWRWCVCIAVLFAGSVLRAQQSSAAIGNAVQQEQRSARFLAERSLRRGGSLNYARMLAGARARHRLAVRGMVRGQNDSSMSTGTASLTAAWQAVGPAQVSTAEYGLVTGRVTTGQTAVSSVRLPLPHGIGIRGRMLALLAPFGLIAIRRRRWRAAVLLCAVLLWLPLGCGLGVTSEAASSGVSTSDTQANATPPGTYTITVTGIAPGLNHAVQLTLIVE